MSVTKPNVEVLNPNPNVYTPGRSKPISRITFHHIVGDAPAAISTFNAGVRGDSSSYIIGSDGHIYQYVPENDTPWTDGNWDSNCRSITIEHAGGHPSVPYTDAMYEASAHLVAYLINKYGIGDFKRHRDVIDTSRYPGGTACPGDLSMERIIARAQQIIADANRPVPAPVPDPAPAQPPQAQLAIEDIPNKPVRIIKAGGAELWELGFTDWSGPNGPKSLKHFNQGDIINDVSAIATHPLGGRYYITEYSYGKGLHNGVNVVDCEAVVETPAPAPAEPTPAPTPEPGKASGSEPDFPAQLLATPLDLVTKKDPTNVWDLHFAHYPDAKADVLLPLGTPFRAVAKYTHPLGSVYFLDQASYDSKTLQGINTVDLGPKPALTIVDNSGAPEAAAAAPEAKIVQSADENSVPVKVLPGNPDAWKATFKTNSAGDYIANADTKVYDLADIAADPQQLVKNQRVKVAGTFTGPDKIEYYRTVKSTETGVWRGIPTVALSAESLLSDAAMLLNPNFIQDAREEVGRFSTKEKAIRKLAQKEVDGLLKRLKKH